MSRFFLQIFAIKTKSRQKTEQMQKFLAPIFFRGDDPGRLLSRFTVHRVAKFGWVPFADVRLRSLAIKYKAEFT